MNALSSSTENPVSILIDRFEGSIVLGHHPSRPVRERYARSRHVESLLKLGRAALPFFALHLSETKDRQEFAGCNAAKDLHEAWVLFLKDLALRCKIEDKPKTNDFDAWMKWAATCDDFDIPC